MKRRLPILAGTVLALTLIASGCGGGATTAGGHDPSPRGPASVSDPSAATPHRRSNTTNTGGAGGTGKLTPVSNRVARRGSYDDTTGIGNRVPRTQTAVLKHLPGSVRPRCVSVGRLHDVRSGALAMGDFSAARAAYFKTKGAYDAQPTQLYVIPNSRDTKRVTLTLTRLGGGAPPIRVASRNAATAAQWKFFPVSLAVTRAGTWQIRATAGAAHGCFVVTFAS